MTRFTTATSRLAFLGSALVLAVLMLTPSLARAQCSTAMAGAIAAKWAYQDTNLVAQETERNLLNVALFYNDPALLATLQTAVKAAKAAQAIAADAHRTANQAADLACFNGITNSANCGIRNLPGPNGATVAVEMYDPIIVRGPDGLARDIYSIGRFGSELPNPDDGPMTISEVPCGSGTALPPITLIRPPLPATSSLLPPQDNKTLTRRPPTFVPNKYVPRRGSMVGGIEIIPQVPDDVALANAAPVGPGAGNQMATSNRAQQPTTGPVNPNAGNQMAPSNRAQQPATGQAGADDHQSGGAIVDPPAGSNIAPVGKLATDPPDVKAPAANSAKAGVAMTSPPPQSAGAPPQQRPVAPQQPPAAQQQQQAATPAPQATPAVTAAPGAQSPTAAAPQSTNKPQSAASDPQLASQPSAADLQKAAAGLLAKVDTQKLTDDIRSSIDKALQQGNQSAAPPHGCQNPPANFQLNNDTVAINQASSGGAACGTHFNLAPGNTLTSLDVIAQPAHGTVRNDGAGITYQPSSGYSGADQYAVRLCVNRAGGTGCSILRFNVAANAQPQQQAAASPQVPAPAPQGHVNAPMVNAPSSTPMQQQQQAAVAPPAAAPPAPPVCIVNSGDWRTGQSHTRTMTASSNSPCTKEDYQPSQGTQVLGITVTAPPGHGQVTPRGGGWTYQAAPNYRGPDTFSVAVRTNVGTALFTYQVTVR